MRTVSISILSTKNPRIGTSSTSHPKTPQYTPSQNRARALTHFAERSQVPFCLTSRRTGAKRTQIFVPTKHHSPQIFPILRPFAIAPNLLHITCKRGAHHGR